MRHAWVVAAVLIAAVSAVLLGTAALSAVVAIAVMVLLVVPASAIWLMNQDRDDDRRVSVNAIRHPRNRRLRTSRDERETVVELLERHFDSGRLTESEFLSRRAGATRAVTRGDLADLLHDLPRLPDARATRYRMHEAYDDRAA